MAASTSGTVVSRPLTRTVTAADARSFLAKFGGERLRNAMERSVATEKLEAAIAKIMDRCVSLAKEVAEINMVAVVESPEPPLQDEGDYHYQLNESSALVQVTKLRIHSEKRNDASTNGRLDETPDQRQNIVKRYSAAEKHPAPCLWQCGMPHIASLEFDTFQSFDAEGRLTFGEWLEKFDDYKDSQTVPWSNAVQLAKLKRFLEGDARERLLRIMDDMKTQEGAEPAEYKDVRARLLDSFKQDGTSRTAVTELMYCRQKPDESVTTFLERIRRIVNRLNPDADAETKEQRMFQEFMWRLRDDIADPLRISLPEGLSQARTRALAIESINASRSRKQPYDQSQERLLRSINALLEDMEAREADDDQTDEEDDWDQRATTSGSHKCSCNCHYSPSRSDNLAHGSLNVASQKEWRPEESLNSISTAEVLPDQSRESPKEYALRKLKEKRQRLLQRAEEQEGITSFFAGSA